MMETYMYYNMVAALTLIAVAAGVATYYWRKRMAVQQEQDEARMKVELFRAGQAKEHMMAEARNNQDMMTGVLAEVRSLQEGIGSLLQLLTDLEMTPGQREWELACTMIKKKSLLLSQLLTVSLELMSYEDNKKLETKDMVRVNDFCHDVFEGCLFYLNEGVDTEIETALDDDYTLTTNAETLKRILQNLLLNSMSNTCKGCIKLAIGEIKKKRMLIFTVRDTAPAIPPEYQGRIFNWLPKNNLHQMLMTLRVRACKLMVKLLGGTLYIDSGYEHGVSIDFTVAMPHN